MSRRCVFKLLLLLLPVFFINKSKGQSYGLQFLDNAVEEKKTSLDLFPKNDFQVPGNFQMSFEIMLVPNQLNYFGYIFRIIDHEKSIDLVCGRSDFLHKMTDSNYFKLVIDDRFTKINFNIPEHQAMNQWTKVTLAFDYDHNRLILFVNNKRYIENNAQLDKKSMYRFMLGVNNDVAFKTNGCTPMKIRNIKIESENKTRFFWPLNETNGNIAYDVVNGQKATVLNPLWVHSLHNTWTFQKNFRVNGAASVAFNQKEGLIYIISADSLLTYSIKNSNLTAVFYSSGQLNPHESNQSVYDNKYHTLYNYYLDHKTTLVSAFDFNLNKWDKPYPQPPFYSDYWNTNNFFAVADTSLYVLDGYGQLKFKNTVKRYNTITRQWKDVPVKGDYFWPRHLAAAGTADSGRTVYILGGYGNKSGLQVLNPKNLYDLMRFDTKTKTFKKLYDLKVNKEGFTFSNSMLIYPKSKTYFVLANPNGRFNSYLQLLMGHLDNPSYQFVGSTIPYKFHDTQSFAGLYYDPASQKMIAVTLLRSQNNKTAVKQNSQTTVNIYTLLNTPGTVPGTDHDDIKEPNDHSITWILISTIIAGLIIIAVYIINRRKYAVIKAKPATEPNKSEFLKPEPLNNEKTANTIFLFGDMQLISQDGEDIFQHFTTLLKELFLLILIYSLRSGRGLSSEKLVEFLWPDKSGLSAKNNGYTNLSRLKTILQQVNHINLYKASGKWKIDIDYSMIYLDYYYYLQIVADRKTITKDKITQLMEITQRGNFLSGFEYPWLDQMKSEISNETIDMYLEYANKVSINDDPEFLIKLSNKIFYLDSVNEEAMVLKCKALAHIGKHSLAKAAFENFTKEFKTLYGEEFKKDFNTILE